MSFPKDRRKILRSSPNSGHSESLPILISRIIEIVFALSKVYEFKLILLSYENICWFDVPMADSFALEERAGGYERAVEFNELFFCPVQILFFSLSEQILQVHVVVHILCNNTQFIGVVLCFAQVVPK